MSDRIHDKVTRLEAALRASYAYLSHEVSALLHSLKVDLGMPVDTPAAPDTGTAAGVAPGSLPTTPTPPPHDAFVAVGSTRFSDGQVQTEDSLASARAQHAADNPPPPVPSPAFTAGDMSDAAASGFRAGQAAQAPQPQPEQRPATGTTAGVAPGSKPEGSAVGAMGMATTAPKGATRLS